MVNCVKFKHSMFLTKYYLQACCTSHMKKRHLPIEQLKITFSQSLCVFNEDEDITFKGFGPQKDDSQDNINDDTIPLDLPFVNNCHASHEVLENASFGATFLHANTQVKSVLRHLHANRCSLFFCNRWLLYINFKYL